MDEIQLDAVLEIKTRTQFLMVYCDRAVIDLVIALHYKQIMHYAFCKHDKDVKANGDPVEPHYHIALHLRTDYSLRTVINWFKEYTKQNVMCEVLANKTKAFEYLIHQNKPEKYQYPKSDLVTDCENFWYSKEEKFTEMMRDINRGADLGYLYATYGRDFALHREAYLEAARAYASVCDDELLDSNNIEEKKYEVL